MQVTRFRLLHLSTMIFIVLWVFVWVLSSSGAATAFDFHADSAHGNRSYGVNRLSAGYDIGDCAHCHDTFDDSICGEYNFMLFYDDVISACDLFCFTCHSGYATWQSTVNYPYAVNFGGGPAIYYPHIYTQFCNANSMPANCGSRHNLEYIHDNIDDLGWGFSSDPDPCVACHPPHAAQRNHPVEIDGEDKLNTAIRRPEHYKNTIPQYLLWGDDANERMSTYASSVSGTYQAPFYGSPGDPISGPFEPANNSTSDGSNLPDYVTFCMDCHQYEMYDPDRDVTVVAIDWGSTGDRHGGYTSNTCSHGDPFEGTLKAPYIDSPNSNYVLSCLDCHEPHGTYQRLHLIRRMINGEIVDADTGTCDGGSSEWADICGKCHEFEGNHLSWGACIADSCHGGGGPPYVFHGSKWNPESFPNCANEPVF